jgi:L-ribulose-5-phosphate 3-epimerase
MILGYNTNGLAHHDPIEAVELLAEIGYRAVALSIDHGLLNPFDRRVDWDAQIEELRACLQEYNMRSVIETGARFLLDPRVKHEPTLMSPRAKDRQRRVDFLCRAIDAARTLGSDCVSLWSGVLRDELSDALDSDAAFDRLAASLTEVLAYAGRAEVTLGFEPEPGMFIDDMSRFSRLIAQLDTPDRLRLTLDIGHLHCLHEPIEEVIRLWKRDLVNVHIEDMRRDRHEHLMFGEGEIDFPPVIAALANAAYDGPLCVELSRHSHMGPTAARQAFDYLQPLCEAHQ